MLLLLINKDKIEKNTDKFDLLQKYEIFFKIDIRRKF